MELPQYQVLRIWKTTHRILRHIAAHTDESLVELLDRMAREEHKRIEQKRQDEKSLEMGQG